MAVYLTNDDVRTLLPMSTCIEVMEEVFNDAGSGEAECLPKQAINFPGGFHKMMMGVDYRMGVFGFKSYSRAGTSNQPRRGGGVAKPWYVLLNNLSDGSMRAFVDAVDLSQIRTGAVGGLAVKYMARANAEVLGIIGTGWEAQAQVEAIAQVRKLQLVKAYSRSSDNREKFAKEMQEKFGVNVVPVDSVRECVEDADIVATATKSSVPLFEATWLKAGAHVNAVGSTVIVDREVDESTIARCDLVCVEDIQQARTDCGELLAAVECGVLKWAKVVELSQLVTGKIPGRTSDNDITMFNSLGIAIEDIASAFYVVRRAEELGVGKELNF